MSKKQNLVNLKKLKLIKAKNLHFANIHFFKADFLIIKAKKTFKHLLKIYCKPSNFCYIYLKYSYRY